jgi:hypothetical protein
MFKQAYPDPKKEKTLTFRSCTNEKRCCCKDFLKSECIPEFLTPRWPLQPPHPRQTCWLSRSPQGNAAKEKKY